MEFHMAIEHQLYPDDMRHDGAETELLRARCGSPEPAFARDGSAIILQDAAAGRQSDSSSEWFFPSELESAYLAAVRLASGAGAALLVDTGSPSNICGSEWSREMAAESAKAGYAPEYAERERPMRCSGVGTGSQTAEWNVRHRICLGDDRVDRFEAPELPDSHTPALLGQNSMAKKRVILDTFTKKFYMVGPGGYEIRLSPGSQVLDMEESKMGHLMLPCSRFGQQSRPTQDSQNFIVGERFASS